MACPEANEVSLFRSARISLPRQLFRHFVCTNTFTDERGASDLDAFPAAIGQYRPSMSANLAIAASLADVPTPPRRSAEA
jgi:hypothetical protein